MTNDESRQVWALVEAAWPEAPIIDPRIVHDHLRSITVADGLATAHLLAAEASPGRNERPSLSAFAAVAARVRREREALANRDRRRQHLANLRSQLRGEPA